MRFFRRLKKITPEALLEILNSIHPSVQSSMEVSGNYLPVLDILINKEVNKMWMNLLQYPPMLNDTLHTIQIIQKKPILFCQQNLRYC